MLTLAVDSACPDDATISRAAELLRGGMVVAYPTDTLYGLAADPTSVARSRMPPDTVYRPHSRIRNGT